MLAAGSAQAHEHGRGVGTFLRSEELPVLPFFLPVLSDKQVMRQAVLGLVTSAVLVGVLFGAAVLFNGWSERESGSNALAEAGVSESGASSKSPARRTTVSEELPEDIGFSDSPNPDAKITLQMWPVPRSTSQWLTVRVYLHGGPEIESRMRELAGAPPIAFRVFRTLEFSTQNVSTPSTALHVAIPVPSARDLFIVIGPRAAEEREEKPPLRGLARQVTDSMRLDAGENRTVLIDLGATSRISGQIMGVRNVAEVEILAELEPAHDPLGLRSSHYVEVLRPDMNGRFEWVGLPVGRVSLSYRNVLPGYPRVPHLVDMATGNEHWDVPGAENLRVTVHEPVFALRLDADGRHIERRFSVGLDSPAEGETSRDHPLVDLRGLEAAKVEKLHFFVDGVGHFAHPWRALQTDENGCLLIPVPDRRGGILVRHEAARDSAWRVSARPAHLPEFPFPFAGIKAVPSADGWHFEGLEAGDYLLHWWQEEDTHKRADMAQVVTVRNGQVAKVLATPPDFKTMRVCVTNWDVIPSDLRPSSVAIGRIRCREASKDSGVYTAELPVPFQWGARAMFWVPDAGVNLTSNDLVVGESSLNLRFPLERFDIEVDVVPRFGGHIGFGRYHTEWMGIGISQTWCSPVAQRKSGRFLLSRTADSEPIHCQVTERHPVSGETILRGWVKLDSRTGVVPLNPGGRWVRIELGQGVERADVLLIGPVSEHDLGPAGFWYKISQARKLWIPEGTRIVQVWQEGGHRDVPAREANQRLVVSRM